MGNDDPKLKFALADQLAKDERYEESLAVLYELNESFPNTKNILFPIAQNLANLSRYSDAMSVCTNLIASFSDARALQLQEQLEQAMHPALNIAVSDEGGLGKLGGTGVDDLLGSSTSMAATAPIPVDNSPEWGRIFLIGGVVIGLITMVVIGIMALGNMETEGEGGGPSIDGASVLVYIGFYGIAFVIEVGVAYLTLAILGQLPNAGFFESLIVVGKVMFVVVLLSFIPIIGGIAGLIFLVKTFELGFRGCLLYLFMNGIIFVLLALMLVGLLGPEIFEELSLRTNEIHAASQAGADLRDYMSCRMQLL